MWGVGTTLKSNQSLIDFEVCWSNLLVGKVYIQLHVLVTLLHMQLYMLIYAYSTYLVVSNVWGQLN